MNRILLIILFSISLSTNPLTAQKNNGFELPQIPSDLKEPQKRAAFLAIHFWDNIPFSSDSVTEIEAIIDRNFADYGTLYPILTPDDRKAAVESLMKRAHQSQEAYMIMADMAEKYFYEPESPVFNEEVFELFLEEMINSDFLSETEKERPKFLLDDLKKNYPGEVATDFTFELPNGRKMRLSDLQATSDILLIFFDPDCDHCRQTLENLKNSKYIQSDIDAGRLVVAAIYSGDEKQDWLAYASTLPESWHVGYEPGDIYEEALYSIRTFPTIYLLDKDLRVVRRNFQLYDNNR